MDNTEIKKANRKSLPIFLLIVFISILLGGFLGFFAAAYNLNSLTSFFSTAGEFFAMNIAPWLTVITAIALPAVCAPIYLRAQRLLATWDGEDESLSAAIDYKLSIALWISSMTLILSFLFTAASYSCGSKIFDSHNLYHMILFFINIVFFLAILAESILIHQKCVDAGKKLNPEKTASVYDPRFQKKWLDSCDEAEKILIGKCAMSAFTATNTICTILSIVLSVCALFFGIGFLPSLVVCLIWMINHSVYSFQAIRFSKPGHKIS